MAFSDRQNLALNARVEASSAFTYGYVWSPDCLTDGFSLFSPIDHHLTNPEQNFYASREHITLSADLGRVCAIDELRLWPTVHSIQHNFPPSSGIGFPESIHLELATQPDFSDARIAYHLDLLGMRPGAGPLMCQLEPTPGRYVRLTLARGMPDFRHDRGPRIMLSEIQLLEQGQVITGGIPFGITDSSGPPVQPAPPPRTANSSWTPPEIHGLEELTDDQSPEGRILPLRDWLLDFRRRVELEGRLARLQQRLPFVLQQEEARLQRIFLGGVILLLVLLWAIWFVRAAAHRKWARMRERIACDLHDEIGANVSIIAHTAELLGETMSPPSESQARLLRNLIESARLTSKETKHFIRFIESEAQDRDLGEQFQRVADQVLGTLPASLSLENMRSFNALEPSTKWNLLLFYKEALNNIIKHARATRVDIATSRQGNQLVLRVSDNGRGLPGEAGGCRHLESRAAMLGGQLVTHSHPPDRPGSLHGTTVTLTFPRNPKP